MHLPKIEEQILKQRNTIGTTATFLSLGSAALLATQGLSTLPLLTVSLPLFIDILTLNELAKKNTNFKTKFYICDPTFKIRMGRWFKKYINETDDLIEKKYRSIFLHAWIYKKHIPIKELVPSNFNAVEKLFDELKDKKLTNYSIYASPQQNFITNIVNFLDEDKNDSRKIAIAKRIYEEYKTEGALGRAFLENIQFPAYSFLHDHKLTSKDYEVIEKNNSHARLDIYEETIEEIINNVLDKENNIKHLKILDNHCNKILENKTSFDSNSIINMQKAIASKIEYLELSEEIGINNINSNKTNRVKL